MTTRLETLRSLQTRLREATGPDRELDARIVCALLASETAYVEQSKLNGAWCIYDGVSVRTGAPRLWEPSGKTVAWKLYDAEFTTDPDGLGACVALMREVLPGWLFDIRQQHQDDFQARVHRRCLKRTPHDDVFASHRLATHATLLAIVSALIAIEEQAKEKADV